MRHRGGILTLAIGILLGVSFAAANLGYARAHALLDRSFPEPNAELAEPPRLIELYFTEPLESGFSSIRLIDSLGGEIPISPAVVDPADPTRMTSDLSLLGPGVYTVAYRSLSQVDGHEWAGSFPFTVLNPDGSRPEGGAAAIPDEGMGELPDPAEVITRWLGLMGGVFLFGAPLFILAVARPAGSAAEGSLRETYSQEASRLALLGVWAGSLAVISGSWLGILNQSLQVGGLDQAPSLVLGTRAGTLVLGRTVLAFSMMLVALSLPQPRPILGRERVFIWIVGIGYAAGTLLLASRILQGESLLALALSAAAVLGLALDAWSRGAHTGARTWRALLVLSIPILLTFSLGSHAGAVQGSIWATIVDFAHFAAASAWAGGLLLLAILTWRVWKVRPGETTQDRLDGLLRFSRLASLAVFVLLSTGLFSSLVELPDLQSLFTTTYGRVLLLKLFLVGIALGIALLNNRLVHRRLGQPGKDDAGRRFQRQVTLETIASLGIMLVAAVLVQTPPPRPQAGNAGTVLPDLPTNALAVAGDLYAHLKVTPNQAGENEFWVHLYHADGSPIGDVQLARLSFEHAEMQMGASQLDLVSSGQDVFEAMGANLGQAGLWDVSIYVRRRGLDDVLGQVTLDVQPLAGGKEPVNPWGSPIPGLPPLVVTGGALAFLGLVPIVWGRGDRKVRSQGAGLTLAGDLAVVIGVVMVVGGVAGYLLQERLNPGKPAPSSESIAAGEALYLRECSVCHGETGRGDGPLGLTLRPPPAVLTAHVPLHSDEELFDFIARGFPGTAMRAYESELSAEEIWNLVNYLRDRYGEFVETP